MPWAMQRCRGQSNRRSGSPGQVITHQTGRPAAGTRNNAHNSTAVDRSRSPTDVSAPARIAAPTRTRNHPAQPAETPRLTARPITGSTPRINRSAAETPPRHRAEPGTRTRHHQPGDTAGPRVDGGRRRRVRDSTGSVGISGDPDRRDSCSDVANYLHNRDHRLSRRNDGAAAPDLRTIFCDSRSARPRTAPLSQPARVTVKEPRHQTVSHMTPPCGNLHRAGLLGHPRRCTPADVRRSRKGFPIRRSTRRMSGWMLDVLVFRRGSLRPGCPHLQFAQHRPGAAAG